MEKRGADKGGDKPPHSIATAARMHWTGIAMVGAAYCQLVLGALLRHVSTAASPSFFGLTVYGHLIVAGVLAVLIFTAAWGTLRAASQQASLRMPALTLMLLIVVQLVLGCATWVVNYYWPGWVPRWDLVIAYTTVEAKGLVQTMIVTAHQATGSLLLGVSVLFTLRSMRFVQGAFVDRPARVKALRGATA
jgi:cytochrome c oxidase assembly protein subunit 15